MKPHSDQESPKADITDLTAALQHIRSAISCLGSEMNTKIHQFGIDAQTTLVLAQEINALSDLRERIERWPEAVEYVVSLRDDKDAVIAERQYAHGLGEALEWAEEMKKEMPWAADSLIEEREAA
jgi:hypothetical protein